MSIDILSYTANKEVTYLCTQLSGLQTTLTSKYVCLNQNTATCISCWRNMETDIPALFDNSNVICVYGSTYFYEGYCCAWTVPSGVCKARFELWGPGATSGVANCCGSAPWGTNGTFMAFTIPVTPGCVYTLCAGCSNAFCSYCCACSTYASACCNGTVSTTFVSGYGLCNICAPGGCTDLVQNMCARLCRIGYSIQGGQQTAPTPCKFVNECFYKLYPNACGPNICYCYGICQPGSQPSYMMSPVADWNVWPCGCITFGLCSYHPIHRIPSIHNGLYVDTNNYGYAYHMPTYPKCGWGSPVTCNNMGCFTEYNFTSNCCAPCFYSMNSQCCCYQIPGLGGGFVHAMAGAVALYGDRGRGGFVKVIYSCACSGGSCAN